MKTLVKLFFLTFIFVLLVIACEESSVSVTKCDRNRESVILNNSFKKANFYKDGPRESLYTEEADKTCHAKMSIDILYPRFVRVYKYEGKKQFFVEEYINIQEHIGFEFGTIMGWFPEYSYYETESETIAGNQNAVFRIRCDQAAKNSPDDYVKYRTEVWLKNSYLSEKAYQYEQEFYMTDAEIDSKLNDILDYSLDETPDEYFEDERYYFTVFIPAYYEMKISYTSYIPEENE